MIVSSKKHLAIVLSKLKSFSNPKLELEQYQTDSEVASEVLWRAKLCGDIENKVVCNLGAGTGTLGVGALLLGAKKVYFVEIDEDAIGVLLENLKTLKIRKEKYEIFNLDVKDFNIKVDTVVTNPPFAVHKKGIDVPFLETSSKIARVVYLIHKREAKDYVLKFFFEKGFHINILEDIKLPIKKTYIFHEKSQKIVNAFWIRAEKNYTNSSSEIITKSPIDKTDPKGIK